LEEANGQLCGVALMEDGSTMFDVLSIEGAECM
jgi:hypothetical protein